MSDPIQFRQPVAPIAVMFARLNRDAEIGGPLYGLKVRPAMIDLQNLGADDLPMICPDDISSMDQIFAGAKAAPTDTGSVNLQAEASLAFLLAVDRDHGLFQTESARPLGVVDWATVICDSLETNDSGECDALLDGTCKRPLMLNYDNMSRADRCVFLVITINYFPHPFARGTRRDMMRVPYISQSNVDKAAPVK